MSTKVYANGREISGRFTGNKSLAAMPDVCLSPPAPPAGPIPIPYPNTSQASNTNGGSKTVTILGDEAGLKNQSDYKKSVGNEAATRNFGAGVVSHNLSGKMKHVAWSFDVKFEGANVVRHMDLTTHNHVNQTNGGTTVNAGGMSMATADKEKDCAALAEDNKALQESIQSGEEATKGGPTAKALEEKTTLTTAQYQHPDGSKFDMKGFSREVKSDSYSKGVGTNYVKDAETGVGKHFAQPSNVPGWKYSDGGRPHSSHTECRILEDIFESKSKPMGKLLMSIRWHKGDGDTSFKPCPRCQKIICEAKNNGMEVEFCDKRGKRWTVDCSKKKPKVVPVRA